MPTTADHHPSGTLPTDGRAVRYGVFLRPDPLTCAALTRITDQLRAQYGLLSAGAFPPHATLAGSLPTDAPSTALHEALDDALADRRAFPVHNAGVTWLHESVLVYDIHMLDDGPNRPLLELAETVGDAVGPLLAPVAGLAPDVFAPGRWRAHLSLASHDLVERPDLREEVERYVRALNVPYPPVFVAEHVALYRLEHGSWTGAWWRTMTWEHLRTWRLSPLGTAAR